MKHVVGLLLCCQFLCACASAQSPPPTPESLAKILLGYDEHERVAATLALGKLGKAALPAVRPLYSHEDETARYYAAWAVGAMGPQAASELPSLRKLLDDGDVEVRCKALHAIARIGQASKETLELLMKFAGQDRDRDLRAESIRQIGELGLNAVGPLRTLLADPKRAIHVVHEAESVLRRYSDQQGPLPPEARKLLLVLASNLDHMHVFLTHRNRSSVTELFAEHADEVLAHLQSQASGPDPSLQSVRNLGQLVMLDVPALRDPRRIQAAVKVLQPLLEHRDPELREAAHWALSSQPSLLRGLVLRGILDEDAKVRAAALDRCIDFLSVEKLRKDLAKQQGKDRLPVARILATVIDDDNATKILRELLDDADASVCLRAACALSEPRKRRIEPRVGGFGRLRDAVAKPHARQVAVLIDGLKHPEATARIRSATAILELANSKFAVEAAQATRDALKDSCVEVRRDACQALLAWNRAGRAATDTDLAAAIARSSDPDVLVRHFAVELIGSHPNGAVPLAKLLGRCSDKQEAEYIANLLAVSAEKVAAATPILVKMLDDKERWTLAAKILSSISKAEHFPKIVQALVSHEKGTAELFPYPQEVRRSPGKLAESLLRDMGRKESSRRVVKALTQLVRFSNVEFGYDLLMSHVDVFENRLDAIEHDLTHGDRPETLREATATLLELRSLALLCRPKVMVVTVPHRPTSHAFSGVVERSAKLLMQVRGVDDLAARRMARNAQLEGTRYPSNWADEWLHDLRIPWSPRFGNSLGGSAGFGRIR